jgi:hypothetical protein
MCESGTTGVTLASFVLRDTQSRAQGQLEPNVTAVTVTDR